MPQLDFVKGIEPRSDFFPQDEETRYPAFVRENSLTNRIAVIQSTYFPDHPDEDNFDKDVWSAVTALVAEYDRTGSVFALVGGKSNFKEIPLADFAAHLEKQPDPEPPDGLVNRANDEIRICVLVERYDRIGGPYPYSDSIVYSIFSREDIADEAIAFFSKRLSGSEWEVSRQVFLAKDTAGHPFNKAMLDPFGRK